ncbi:restriction endonuclease subunit S [Vibrio parahaemolyticus]|uniref:restriction endonuclease subunit S n=1 Tax=Vibrio parahaemolyticus TaxID=670 RepID=UPI000411C547|nr:restriction endonuclease subunit S [Vibrio parahaemolyticus]EGQ8923896.1 restriction endonuclease subunit S [Vibrio parahaemolyticus]EGQ8953733.1 restriction endonuclease subunit S [Vibrio parahaemolyticus]EGQ8988041.1 restriction endonuclease subunit S [Vibrio parahaemolyticus]EGQ9007321.1 restriction endonuclease subunit S [Vibrio parahaemolyticus]EGR2858447.1 restriction endonuclease subunit S [Vibrio parahaemolyticus]
MNWESVELSDLVEVMHQGINTAADKVNYADVGVPIIQAKHLKNNDIDFYDVKFLGSDDYEKYKGKYIPQKGDLLFSNIGTIGKSVIVRPYEDFMFAWNVFLIRVKHEQLDVSYLKYYLDYLLSINYYERFLTGGTVKFVNKKTMGGIKVPLPPLDEQKRIAAILDKADAIRQKRKQAIELADEFLRSVFLDMFGDPVTNPKGWEVKPLKCVADIVTGNTPSRNDAENYGAFIEWIKSDNINTPSHFLTQAEEYLSEVGMFKGRTVDEGSILMTCIAGSLSCIGNIAIANRKVAFNQQINALVPNKSVYLEYLYALMLCSKEQIQNSSTNSMKGMVSKGTLSALSFPVASIEEQNKFVKVFNKYLELIDKKSVFSSESANSFNSLSQKAFSGQL